MSIRENEAIIHPFDARMHNDNKDKMSKIIDEESDKRRVTDL